MFNAIGDCKMAKIHIYSYFNAEQTRCLLIDAKKGTRSMLNYLSAKFPNDYTALTEAIADCMPQLVAEDRVYRSGPRKGQRKIVFWNNTKDISDTISNELAGVPFKRFIRAYDYMKKSTVEVVLTPPENSVEYSKHWIKSFLDSDTNFSDLNAHYRNLTAPYVASAKRSVDAWIAANQPDMAELMTWDGNKYNVWHFANMKAA
jgi:hypothetical protein